MPRVVGMILRSKRIMVGLSGSGMGLGSIMVVARIRSMLGSRVEMASNKRIVMLNRAGMSRSLVCMVGCLLRVDIRVISKCIGGVVVSTRGCIVSSCCVSMSTSCIQVGTSCIQVGFRSCTMTLRRSRFTVGGTRRVRSMRSVVDVCMMDTGLCVVLGSTGVVCICLSQVRIPIMVILFKMISSSFMDMCRIRVSLGSRSVVVTSSLICLVQNLS